MRVEWSSKEKRQVSAQHIEKNSSDGKFLEKLFAETDGKRLPIAVYNEKIYKISSSKGTRPQQK